MPRRHEQEDAIAETLDLSRLIERRIEKIETIVMVREPNTQAAADAYDGLRKQVVTAIQERQAHVTQLVQFASAIESGADIATLTAMIDGWLESAGVVVTSDADSADVELMFTVVEDLGGPIQVLAPAYLDTATSRVIRQGRVRRLAPDTPQAATSAKPDDPQTSDEHTADDGADESIKDTK